MMIELKCTQLFLNIFSEPVDVDLFIVKCT